MNHQRRGLPPAHPSLPSVPRITNTSSLTPSLSQAASTTQAIAAALSNPYGQSYYDHSYSSHYAQAYMQGSGWPTTNVQGYTLSSTYVPLPETQSNCSRTWSNFSRSCPSQPFNYQSSSSWYQPGDRRCTYQGCTFTGAHKAVEIHMMDRHLIYPSGWEHRHQKSDWDADPSLKGKPIPIQGTTIVLDTPEVLDAWIAERKKRWPSSTLIEQKKRKREEAIARGQISVDDPSLFGRKRQRSIESSTNAGQNRSRRGKGRTPMDGGWRGRGRGGGVVRQPTARMFAGTLVPESQPAPSSETETSSYSEEDDSPEIISSKPPAAEAISSSIADRDDEDARRQEASTCRSDTRHQSVRTLTAQQPKKPLRNLFASRPTLLRNLLLPEIRITISNLSQAIRFLVDNKFLEGVEVRPGEADERLIEVIGEDLIPIPDQQHLNAE